MCSNGSVEGDQVILRGHGIAATRSDGFVPRTGIGGAFQAALFKEGIDTRLKLPLETHDIIESAAIIVGQFKAIKVVVTKVSLRNGGGFNAHNTPPHATGQAA